MKRLLIVAAFLAVCLPAPAQIKVISGRHRRIWSSGCPFTDSFSGSGALSGSWSAVTATGITTAGASIQRNGGVAQASGTFRKAGAIVSGGTCSFPQTQNAQTTITTNGTAGDTVGVFVLMSTAGNGYGMACGSAGSCTIKRYATGTGTLLLTCTGTGTAGAVIKLSVSLPGGVQTFTCSINGVSGGTTTDSTFTTGFPGLWVDNSSGAAATATQAATFSAD